MFPNYFCCCAFQQLCNLKRLWRCTSSPPLLLSLPLCDIAFSLFLTPSLFFFSLSLSLSLSFSLTVTAPFCWWKNITCPAVGLPCIASNCADLQFFFPSLSLSLFLSLLGFFSFVVWRSFSPCFLFTRQIYLCSRCGTFLGSFLNIPFLKCAFKFVFLDSTAKNNASQ